MAARVHRRLTRGLAAVLLFAGVVSATNLPASDVVYRIVPFDDLEGWANDDHHTALTVFLKTCPDMTHPDWQVLCAVAQDQSDARSFFELFFRPVLIADDSPGLFTGYFEPELEGSLTPDSRFRYPVHGFPSEAEVKPWLSRQEIFESDALAGRGLEIAWVDDPVALYFLQVQGSGRIRLPDGGMIRVGYAGANGHPYRSIGVELVRRGIYEDHQVSAAVIANWVRRNPDEGYDLLFHNPSYVFFREVSQVPADEGPLGAMNRSVTPMRTIAVDPFHTPLGAPVWIETDGRNPMRRLMIAQDTGAAIKGSQRADIFVGTGHQAGRDAGRLKDLGRMMVLMPIQRAYGLLPEGAS